MAFETRQTTAHLFLVVHSLEKLSMESDGGVSGGATLSIRQDARIWNEKVKDSLLITFPLQSRQMLVASNYVCLFVCWFG